MPTAADIKSWIQAGMPDAQVSVAGDDGQHFAAVVVSPAFTGKSLVARHQLVYRALGARMHAEIHALSLETRTPDE